MSTTLKKPRSEKQKAATAKLVAANKAKRDAARNVKLVIEDSAPVGVEDSDDSAPARVEDSEDSDDSAPEGVADIEDSAPSPSDFSNESHHVADSSRERASKPLRRSRTVSAFRYN